MRTFYEFFAGGGMARAGIGQGWKCLFANDFDEKKVATYSDNWGGSEIACGDVNDLNPADLPGHADLIWASFPCQDLSLAGGGAGLKGERSGTFWPFWRHVQALSAAGRKPRFVVLENVVGMLTSHRGADFRAIADALAQGGFRFGAVVVDAAFFVPQSRKRVFIVGVDDETEVPATLVSSGPLVDWHSAALERAVRSLTPDTARQWVWWNLPAAPMRTTSFASEIEANPSDVAWHSPAETAKLLSMMSEHNRLKFEKARKTEGSVVGTLYRRTRPSPDGGVQRAEIRLDGTAGCLRTPAGGSSRQIVVIADSKRVRSRLISSREACRIMGLPDSYKLPSNYNDAYHLLGDGLAVPAVNFVMRNIVDRIADETSLALAA